MIPTSHGPMSPEQLVDELTYINYAHNRDTSNVTPASWKKVYGASVDAMEARYQAEKAITKAAQAGNDRSTAVGGDAPASGGTNQEPA